jgi:uncharacterized protein involved in oxidation of intracellular sulfur
MRVPRIKSLFMLNAAPHGSEVNHNGLRRAAALAKDKHNEIRVYLLGDAVGTAKIGQMRPEGHANPAASLQLVAAAAQESAGCMDARGMHAHELIEGAHRGRLGELAEWSEWADKAFTC